MSKQVYYRQCRLQKGHKDGSYSEQVSYIPEPFCVKDKVLKQETPKASGITAGSLSMLVSIVGRTMTFLTLIRRSRAIAR